jgi:hypothetical protein
VGIVTYQTNVLGTRGPRKIMGVIPALDEQGSCLYQPSGASDTMLDRWVFDISAGSLAVYSLSRFATMPLIPCLPLHAQHSKAPWPERPGHHAQQAAAVE